MPDVSRLLLLAPDPGRPAFSWVIRDPVRYLQCLTDVRALRARAFAHMTADHLADYARRDLEGWHFVVLSDEGRATACVRCLPVTATDAVQLAAYSSDWPPTLLTTVQGDMDRARQIGYAYGEWGSFVVDRTRRGSPDVLLVMLMAYAFGRQQGGALGLTLADTGSGAAAILRRMAADTSDVLEYYDSRFHTSVQLVRFDSRTPARKYEPMVTFMQERLCNLPVVTP